MKTNDMKSIAARYSLDDWQYIAAQPEMFECGKKTPEEVTLICETLILKREEMLSKTSPEEERNRLAILAATFGQEEAK
jgi:hypothetical protein